MSGSETGKGAATLGLGAQRSPRKTFKGGLLSTFRKFQMRARGATKRAASVTLPTPSGMRSGRGCRWQRWTALERRHLVISALMGALGKLVAILVPNIGDVVNPGDRELQWVRGSFAAVDGRRRPMPGSLAKLYAFSTAFGSLDRILKNLPLCHVELMLHTKDHVVPRIVPECGLV